MQRYHFHYRFWKSWSFSSLILARKTGFAKPAQTRIADKDAGKLNPAKHWFQRVLEVMICHFHYRFLENREKGLKNGSFLQGENADQDTGKLIPIRHWFYWVFEVVICHFHYRFWKSRPISSLILARKTGFAKPAQTRIADKDTGKIKCGKHWF